MDVHLLGPIAATLDGRPIPLGATKQRALLAMLALRVNQTVPVADLVDGLWGDEPPATASKMVQLYVSQLRRLLAGNDAEIVTHGRGYELRVPDDAVDASRFERLVEQAGRSGAASSGAAREALALWRGAPLADVADEPFAAAEIRRLQELWITAVELAIDAELSAGRHLQVLADLERLIEQHPLRERLHEQRMLALYRAGRQAEALDAYVATRRRLVADAGIEPSARLRRLHEQMLRQDPSLQLPEAPGDPPVAQRAPESSARAIGRTVHHRYGLIAAAAAVVLAVGVATVSRLDGVDGLSGIDENAVGLIDAATGEVTAQYAVGRDPSALAVGGGSVWVANARDSTVSRIDTGRDHIVTIAVGDDPKGLAFVAGSVWVANRQTRTVSQINPRTNRVVQKFDVGNAPRGITGGFGSIWVTSEVDRTVTRIDLGRGSVAGRIDLGANPTAIAAGAGAVWVTSEEAGTVFRIEPRTGAVARTIGVGNGPASIAAGKDGVWVANRQDGTVSRIDPATDAVTTTVPVGHAPSALAAGAGGVWVANSGEGTVSRIDPATMQPTDTIAIANSPSALAIHAGSVWTATHASTASHRGGTLRVEMSRQSVGSSLEPASYDTQVFELLSLAYDGLVTYRRAGGSTYGQLVGNLATDVPEPSADGRTYVFRLRPGIRYSNGALVRPEDFRASLEDLLRRHGRSLPPFYGSIAGAPACVEAPADCDLSRGIEADANARTITLRLTRPDPELLHKLAFPFAYVVPAGDPFRPKAAPPGTGPYRIVAFVPERRVRLVRNGHFRVWSPDARPDGLADEIDVRLRDDVDQQVAAVQRGEADVMAVSGLFGGPLEPRRLRSLAARSAGQLHTNAAPEVDFMFLNTRTPPFDDVRVRRAVNYAIDRREIGRLTGGPDLAQPTCQLVPPGFPGYTPWCRYTRNPTRAGSWRGPDMKRARRLIERSGTRGMPVTVWTHREKRSIGRYFVSLLRRLGYRSAARVFPSYQAYRPKVADSRTRAQIGIEGWAADFGAPSSFTPEFRCGAFVPRSPGNGNLSQFCDRRIEARIDDASRARGSDVEAIWQDVYGRLADAAPAVPLVNRRTVTLVSKRVGNHQHHPMWGTLLDQLWVR